MRNGPVIAQGARYIKEAKLRSNDCFMKVEMGKGSLLYLTEYIHKLQSLNFKILSLF